MMEFTLVLPTLSDDGSPALIRRLHVEPNQSVTRGAALLDISITLGGGQAHDCPPISPFRIHAREAATLTQWHVKQGDSVAPDTILASLQPQGVPNNSELTRPLRQTVSGIIPDDEF